MQMQKRKLLLCFDAFGTLFRPKRPIAQQYGETARQCGVKLKSAGLGDGDGDGDGNSDEQLDRSFRAAFKHMARAHPNYGRATGMGAEAWWTHVIEKTFHPLLVPPNQTLPSSLAPKLLHRFASSEGYTLLAPRLPALLRALKEPGSSSGPLDYDEIVVGVVTNSDDRVPAILSSFGLAVSPMRYGTPVDDVDVEHDAVVVDGRRKTYDVDFHCMSYDVGCEKPHERIFRAAEQMAALVAADRRCSGAAASISTSTSTTTTAAASADAVWDKVYVGDDYDKDVVGARNARWTPVFVGSGAQQQQQQHEEANVWTLASLLSRPGRAPDAILSTPSVEAFLTRP